MCELRSHRTEHWWYITHYTARGDCISRLNQGTSVYPWLAVAQVDGKMKEGRKEERLLISVWVFSLSVQLHCVDFEHSEGFLSRSVSKAFWVRRTCWRCLSSGVHMYILVWLRKYHWVSVHICSKRLYHCLSSELCKICIHFFCKCSECGFMMQVTHVVYTGHFACRLPFR